MKSTERILSLVSLIFGAVAALASALIVVVSLVASLTANSGQSELVTQASRVHALAMITEAISPFISLLWGSTLLFGVALFVVGIGLYRESRWAWTWAFRWSVAALVSIPVHLWLQLGVIAPRTNAAIIAMDATSADAAPMTQGEWMLVIVRHVLIYAPLPIMLLIVAPRARAKAVAVAS